MNNDHIFRYYFHDLCSCLSELGPSQKHPPALPDRVHAVDNFSFVQRNDNSSPPIVCQRCLALYQSNNSATQPLKKKQVKQIQFVEDSKNKPQSNPRYSLRDVVDLTTLGKLTIGDGATCTVQLGLLHCTPPTTSTPQRSALATDKTMLRNGSIITSSSSVSAFRTGTSSTVDVGCDAELASSRFVAVKFVSAPPEDRRMRCLASEAAILRTLCLPLQNLQGDAAHVRPLPPANLVASLGILPALGQTVEGHCAHQAAFVLEYCDGGTLQQLVEHVGPLNEREAAAVFYCICCGVEYLHEQLGVLHRDIKPTNVMLCKSDNRGLNIRPPFVQLEHWRVKLTDFGIARDIDMAQTVCGTHRYMAPEIIHVAAFKSNNNANNNNGGGGSNIHNSSGSVASCVATSGSALYSVKVDVFSLGVLLQFMLSGGISSSLRAPWCTETTTTTAVHATSERNSVLSTTSSSSWVIPRRLLCGKVACGNKIHRDFSDVISSCNGMQADTIELVNRMVSVNPNQRPTLQQIFEHPFLSRRGKLREMKTPIEVSNRRALLREEMGLTGDVTSSLSRFFPLPGFFWEPPSISFLARLCPGMNGVVSVLKKQKMRQQQQNNGNNSRSLFITSASLNGGASMSSLVQSIRK